MYYYRQTEPGLYTVGCDDGEIWQAESDHDNIADAAARVSYLNGGKQSEALDVLATKRLDRIANALEQTVNAQLILDRYHKLLEQLEYIRISFLILDATIQRSKAEDSDAKKFRDLALIRDNAEIVRMTLASLAPKTDTTTTPPEGK